MMTTLTLCALTVKKGQKILVENASLCLRPGELVVVLGPNGAGKTSLIRAGLGLERYVQGSVYLDEQPLEGMAPVTRARHIAYLPQDRPLAWPYTVRDIVALGRYSHGVTMGRLHAKDVAIINKIMKECHLTHLGDQRSDTLSGGELARVHCARALVAQTPLLIADEPTLCLDPNHQRQIMDLIKAFVTNGGGALVVLHDIELAIQYASRLVWMKGGHILYDDPMDTLLIAERFKEIYNVETKINGSHILIER